MDNCPTIMNTKIVLNFINIFCDYAYVCLMSPSWDESGRRLSRMVLEPMDAGTFRSQTQLILNAYIQ